MASFNKVILLGNLTRDPELKYTPKGTAVAQIGLAVNRVYSNEQGEKVEEVTFVDVDLFGRTAEIANEYLRKGRPVLIEGRLKLDTWEDKNTKQKVSKLKVVLESFSFIDSNRADGAGGAPPPSRPSSAPSSPAAEPPDGDVPPESDDVPF